MLAWYDAAHSWIDVLGIFGVSLFFPHLHKIENDCQSLIAIVQLDGISDTHLIGGFDNILIKLAYIETSDDVPILCQFHTEDLAEWLPLSH